MLPAVDAVESAGTGADPVPGCGRRCAHQEVEGTRRRHPQAARGVVDSIADERLLLKGLRDRAGLVVDTGDLNTNQLRVRLMEPFGG